MADAPIPVYHDLEAVYGEGAAEARERYISIRDAFTDRFGAEPDLYARSPGRVNLIGEHIDYEGYGVLPMAIKQDTIIAIRRGGDQLVITNLEKDKYQDVTFSVDPKQKVDTERHVWANYFLAAYKGVFEHLKASGHEAPAPVGLQVMVHGIVPTGSGLSSSSAFVCAAALGLLGLAASGSDPTPPPALPSALAGTKAEVADFTCRCERYVGTESGGMDQAISVMGLPGQALRVDFNPLRASEVALPPNAAFVVANSLTVSNKAETGPLRYNMRVVECRLAAAILALKLGQSQASARGIKTLREVEPLVADAPATAGAGGNANVAAVREHLHEEAYSAAECGELLGVPLDRLLEGNENEMRVLIMAAQGGGFKLRQRAEHVFTESLRVGAFADVCAGTAGPDEKLASLGQLMDDSQASCRDLYECSCEELDALVAAAKQAGALGARLTGAGWGGCTVSLVRLEAADAFIEQVKASYYAPLVAAGRVSEGALGECIFATRPACGGGVLKLKL